MWSLPPSAALTGGGTINRTAEPVDLPSVGKIKKKPSDKERLTSFLKQQLSLLLIVDRGNAHPPCGLEG